MSSKVFRGTVFEVAERSRLSITEDALVVVSPNGVIEAVLNPADHKNEYEKILSEAEASRVLVTLSRGQYLMPGLVDLHVHAPQWPQLGKALDRKLEVWLQECTFPLEARYADVAFAAEMYNSLVAALLANGTTTVAYFATVHLEASVLLARICIEKGQRAVIGRVAMDLPEQCPSFYRDASAEDSVALSEQFIQQVRALPGNDEGRVLPAVIPRFIPTCSDAALRGLGGLVRQYKCHVQTHCSESDWEHQHVMARCHKRDAEALDDFGLVTRRTVLAHGTHLSVEDMQLIKRRGAAVAHCPLSNYYFSDAVLPLRTALNLGVRVGLGTDISGGPSASLFQVCRDAVNAARVRESGTDAVLPAERRGQPEPARVNHVEAFYMATTLGGEALDLKVGRIAPGYYFDAIVVDTTVPGGNLHIFDGLDSFEDVFQKIVYNVTPVNIAQTYVGGRLVSQNSRL